MVFTMCHVCLSGELLWRFDDLLHAHPQFGNVFSGLAGDCWFGLLVVWAVFVFCLVVFFWSIRSQENLGYCDLV